MSEVFTHASCPEHDVPFGFPERRDRLDRILERLAASREVSEAAAHPAREAALAAVHDEVYLGLFERAVERGDGLLCSADNPLSSGTLEAARGAVDTLLAAADRMMEKPAARPFAAVRPPGHHAERATAMGFCYYNNVAVAAQYLIDRHGLDRVAIFDFDVHHGNGTQHLFEERTDVFFASVHQWPFYPGTGAEGERGRNAGAGATLNVCLAAGAGDDEYRRAIEKRIVPALADFGPQALLVSAGFDAWRADPLGGMEVSEGGFGRWGEIVRRAAEDLCEGRILSTLEGGYDLEALPSLVEAYLG